MVFTPKTEGEEKTGSRKHFSSMSLREIREAIQRYIEVSGWQGKNGIHLIKILKMPMDEFREIYKANKGAYEIYHALGVMRDGAAIIPEGYDGVDAIKAVDLRIEEMHRVDYVAMKQYGDPGFSSRFMGEAPEPEKCIICGGELPKGIRPYCSGKCIADAKESGVYGNEESLMNDN